MSEQDSVDIHKIVGCTIKQVRRMTKEELDHEGWGGRPSPMVLVLDNDTLLFASRDDEGNGPGTLFGSTDKMAFYVDVDC